MYGTYTVTLNELKNVLKTSGQAAQQTQEDGFKEVRSRKRHLTGEATCTTKKAALPTSTATTKNFFASLRTITMDTAPHNIGVCNQTHPVAETTERCGFEFRNTRNGTWVVTKDGGVPGSAVIL
jgi:hypothetical protein